MRAARIVGTAVVVIVVAAGTARGDSIGFVQTNLVSDGAVPAAQTDPLLKNPWGISFGPTTPFWVANNGTGTSTLYRGTGAPQSLIVTIPAAPGSPAGTAGTPTGTVFNGTSSNFLGDRFLFASEDGVITGWQGGTVATVRADNSAAGSIYKGLAMGDGRIFATDFGNGKVDVFDSAYTPLSLPGAFTDPNLPAGFAPFGIQDLGGDLYVTFANKTPGNDDENHGAGLGFVDVFDTNGVLLRRLVSQGALDAPWGLALAPVGFGAFGNALLVGNFGDGTIHAYNPLTGALLGMLEDPSGKPIAIDGLWALAFGNGGPGFSRNTLYFTAGLNDEADGLFGSLEPTPEPGTLALTALGLASLVMRRRRVTS